MTAQYERAHSEWSTAFGHRLRIERAIEFFSQIHSVSGIEIVEESDFTSAQLNYEASHYVFGKQMLEPWAAPGFRLPKGLIYTPLAFLREHGYDLKDRPEAGDVIAYSYDSDANTPVSPITAFVHYGIINADGTVTSKFGVGDVLNHPVDRVPSVCGNFAHFLGRVAMPGPDLP